jgi:L-malate glycosyltransferase
MRILVVIYEFPPVGGGGGRAAQDLYPVLVNLGYEIKLLTSHYKGLARQEDVEGVQVIRVPALRRHAYVASFLTMFAYIVSGFFAGLSLIRRWRPDLIHVHFAVPSGPLAWLLSRFTGVPYILTAHLGDVPGGVPSKTKRWFKWVALLTPPIWRDAAQVVAVSEFTRQLALKHYPVDIQVIPNGVDVAKLAPADSKPGTPPQIVFAGRFVEQKNPLQIVHTLAELRDLDWKCVLMGDGALRAQVEEQLAQQGLEKRVSLPGWVTPEQVLDQFNHSDILFVPSFSEGLPVVGVQALAKGLAIVASNVGGWTDLVDSGRNGYLVDPQHPNEYAKVLRDLLTDEHLLQTFREASLHKAWQFDLAMIAQQYASLYQRVTRPDGVTANNENH